MERIFGGVRGVWLPLYQHLKAVVEAQIGPFEEHVTTSAVLWRYHTAFAEVYARKEHMVVGIVSDTYNPAWGAFKTLQTSKHRVVHYFEVRDDRGFDALTQHIMAAHALSETARPTATLPTATYTTVDEYLEPFSPDIRAVLERVRETIRQAAPQASERISWQMPAYYLKENLVFFAMQKNHIGFYPTPGALDRFQDALAGYKRTKGGVQFPIANPIPYDLIGAMTRFRVEEVMGGEGD